MFLIYSHLDVKDDVTSKVIEGVKINKIIL